MIGAIRNVTRDRAVCPLIDESKKKKKTHGSRLDLPQISEKRPNTWHTSSLKSKADSHVLSGTAEVW